MSSFVAYGFVNRQLSNLAKSIVANFSCRSILVEAESRIPIEPAFEPSEPCCRENPCAATPPRDHLGGDLVFGDVKVRREHAVVARLLRLAPVVRLALLVLLARDDVELLALLLRRELDPARPRDDAGVDLPLVLPADDQRPALSL